MEAIFNLLGGLGFFMYGMHLMSGGLRKVASHQLRRVLSALTKTPLKGLLMGALVTAVVQSSSFTTVMTVGLVNATLLTLRQGICVILGANIGTTVTAWIVGAVGAAERSGELGSRALCCSGNGPKVQCAQAVGPPVPVTGLGAAKAGEVASRKAAPTLQRKEFCDMVCLGRNVGWVISDELVFLRHVDLRAETLPGIILA